MYNSHLYLESEDNASVKKLVALAKQVTLKPMESFSDDSSSEGEASVRVLKCTKCMILSSSLGEYKHKCKKLLAIILNELDDVTKTVPLSNVYLEQFLGTIWDNLVETERIAKTLKRKLSQIKIEPDQVQQKRRKRDFEKNLKTSEKSKASEKLQSLEKIPDQKMELSPLPIGYDVLKVTSAAPAKPVQSSSEDSSSTDEPQAPKRSQLKPRKLSLKEVLAMI